MTEETPRESGGESSPQTKKQTARLIELAMTKSNPMVEELRRRIEAEDGHQWFLSVLNSGPTAFLGSPDLLATGQISLSQLKQIKELSKSLVGQRRDPQARLAGAIGYFLSIAAALTHHHTRICSRPRTELDPVLLDLASVTQSPWSELLSRAAVSKEKEA